MFHAITLPSTPPTAMTSSISLFRLILEIIAPQGSASPLGSRNSPCSSLPAAAAANRGVGAGVSTGRAVWEGKAGKEGAGRAPPGPNRPTAKLVDSPDVSSEYRKNSNSSHDTSPSLFLSRRLRGARTVFLGRVHRPPFTAPRSAPGTMVKQGRKSGDKRRCYNVQGRKNMVLKVPKFT
jgi:hypothetical protein